MVLSSKVLCQWAGGLTELGRAFSGRERAYCLLSRDRKLKKNLLLLTEDRQHHPKLLPTGMYVIISSFRRWKGLSREVVKSPSLGVFMDKDWMWHSVPGSAGMVLFSHRLDLMISKVISDLIDSVILTFCETFPEDGRGAGGAPP